MSRHEKRNTDRSLSEVESAIEQANAESIMNVIGQLGRVCLAIDDNTLRAIRAWESILDHPDSEVRREAYQQLEESITAGMIPEEIGGLFEDVLMESGT